MAISEKNKRILFVIIIAFFCALFAAAGCFLCAARAEEVAESYGVKLTPVTAEGSDIVYRCFDAPVTVFADGKGILVGGGTIEEISGESDITAVKQIGCDKLARHLEHGDHSEYIVFLRDGELYSVYGESEPAPFEFTDKIIDFSIYNDNVYAVTKSSLVTVPLGENGFATELMKQTEIVSDRHSDIELQAVSVAGGDIFVAVRSAFRNKSDICRINGAALDSFIFQTNGVLSLSAYGEYLYALTRGSIVCYKAIGGGILSRLTDIDGADVTAMHAYGDGVYVIDALNRLKKYTADLASFKTLFAASSDSVGFFNMPSGVAVKSSNLYVADTVNDRVAIYGRSASYFPFRSPVSVASDSAGTVYVAYDYNKIGAYADGDLLGEPLVITDNAFGVIRQIAVDTDKTLYIVADGGLFAVKNGETAPLSISPVKLKAITLGVGRDELYGLRTDGKIVKLDRASGALDEVYTVGADAIAIAADLNGTIFTLYADRITCEVDGALKQYPLELDGAAYSLGGKFGAFALCTVDNDFVGYGDVVIADTYKHRVFKTDGKALGVKLVDDSYEVPNVVGDDSLNKYDGLIRVALRDADVFSLPVETTPVYTIGAGRKVIVPQFELEQAKEFALVLIDDLEQGKLVQGYVYKDVLSEPLAYSAPPSEVGTVYTAATPIYKWPSRNSVTVKGFSAVNRNTQFRLLDFVEAYRDDYGYAWYRVGLDGVFEGYVLGVNLSLMSYEPVFIRPAYNAEIISYKDSTFAVGYSLADDGSYTEIARLATGTQVEVVGAFDSSEHYTQVKYLDPELGTLTCYVETVYIKYNGVNVVLIVAVVVIVITVILASIIIVRSARRKKSKIADDD